jgi:Ca-activated chloride channel family protein
VSTFSIDADSGSYTLARAAIRDGVLPDPESVRVEEFLNYFHFHYAQPEADIPLAMYTELGACPWNNQHELLLIGIQGQEVDATSAPPANLVYLLDVSGSMSEASKLPLLKRGFRMLTGQLRAQDRVSIVTYAGQESVVLEGVTGDQKDVIDQALAALESGGSTNGEGGIQKAYQLAEKYFMEGATNRVLLATDGDFNVGLSDVDELVDLIATKRETGVFLSVYGFGSAWDGGNYQDEVAEQLADNGNGVYFFIDGEEEARRAFIYTLSGSLITVAKDVKIQVEFNPDRVAGYRLIGYENRLLSNNDFSNDGVDAGELGASMSVTAAGTHAGYGARDSGGRPGGHRTRTAVSGHGTRRLGPDSYPLQGQRQRCQQAPRHAAGPVDVARPVQRQVPVCRWRRRIRHDSQALAVLARSPRQRRS